MKNLQLSLKKKWFDMTKSGEKTEDYREIKPYWIKRLMYFCLEVDSDFYTDVDIEEVWHRLSKGDISVLSEKSVDFNYFDSNIMTLGYPKKGDKDKVLIIKNNGITIGYGNPAWGAPVDRLVFIIKHGEIIE